MFSLHPKHNINYLARIVRISNLRKHSNADRLQCMSIDGNNVITDMSAKVGDLGIYFPLECKIDAAFLKANNLYREKAQNANQNKAGFFELTGRVRAVKLRGEKSEGFWIPAEALTYAPFNLSMETIETAESQEFDMVGDVRLVRKYTIQHQQGTGEAKVKDKSAKKKVESIVLPEQFNYHIDTPQLGKSLSRLKPDQFVTISQKLHGTSFISSKVLVRRKLSLWERVARFFGAKVTETEYGNLYSSRKVIKNDAGRMVSEDDLWKIVNDKLYLHLKDGMTVYGEAVGFQPSGKWIQKNYDYGCVPGQHEIYVYRITWTLPSGQVVEWNSRQIRSWCYSHGFKMVPELWSGKLVQLTAPLREIADEDERLRVWRDEILGQLKARFLEKRCELCKSGAWDEGIVLRVEDSHDFDVYKLKSFNFLKHESEALDSGEVDLESAESVEEEAEAAA